MSFTSCIKNTFSYFVLCFALMQSYTSSAQSDIIFKTSGTLQINIVENNRMYVFNSNELYTGINPNLKKIEIKVPLTSIQAVDTAHTGLFFQVFNLDTLYDDFLRIYIDFPNDNIVLTDFVNKQEAFVGSVDFGELEIKGQATVDGIYSIANLLFDFEFLLAGPFEPEVRINKKPVTEIWLNASNLTVYSDR